MTLRLFIYYSTDSIIGACAVLSAAYTWMGLPVRLPVTFLAVAVLALYIRQVIYNEIIKDVLKEIDKRQA